MRGVSNMNSGFPNLTGQISDHAATMAEVLHDEGYSTFAVGKWHLALWSSAQRPAPTTSGHCNGALIASTASWTARPTSSAHR